MSTRSLSAVLIFIAFAFANPSLAQTTVTLQEGLNGYTGTADAKIACCDFASTNYGSDTLLSLVNENDTSSVIRFPTFQSEGGPVPNGATITSATLSIYKYFGPNGTFDATRLLKDWNEAQVTWNSTGTGVNWEVGGTFGSTDSLASPDGQGTVGDAGDTCDVSGNYPASCWLNIDVTAGVQAFANSSANHGWRVGYIAGSGTSDATPKNFISHENPSWPHPMLTITYTTSGCRFGSLRPYDASPVNGTPIPIAASGSTVFEAEDFNCGGEGVAYHDSDAVNDFPYFRTGEAVDINNRGGSVGYDVENFATGEWLTYSISVPSSAAYDIQIRASNNWQGSGVPSFHLEVDGVRVSQSVAVPPTGDWTTFTWVTVPNVALNAGTRVLKVVSDQQWFAFDEVQLTFVSALSTCRTGLLRPYDGAPINGNPIAIAATGSTAFEAENFDCGGEGVAYHDSDNVNDFPYYRTAEAVDINNRTGSSGYDVENFATGEWLLYTLNIQASGTYDIAIRASNNWPGPGVPAFHLEIDGVAVSQTITVPQTGDWTAFTWVTVPGITLSAGTRVLKVVSDQQWFAFDQVQLTFDSPPVTCGSAPVRPYSGTPVNGNPFAISTTTSTTFEAEHFDCGGEGLAYHDTDSMNDFSYFRTAEAVDINNRAGASGYDVENFATGEWLVYSIAVPANGNYDIAISASNNWPGPGIPTFHIEVDGSTASQSTTIPATGSWNTFAWTTVPSVALTTGTHLLKIVSDQQWFAFDQVRITPSGTSGGGGTPPSGLLFWSGFEGALNIGTPYGCYPNGCFQQLSGTDSATGYAWPPTPWSGVSSYFQLLVDPAGAHPDPTPDTVGDFMINQIRPGEGRNGTQALFNEIFQSGCCGTSPQQGHATQDPYILAPASEPPDTYISFWFKWQPDWLQRLYDGDQWRQIFEWKTGDPGQDDGDYRISLAVNAYNGNPPWWVASADSNAGGVPNQQFWTRLSNNPSQVPNPPPVTPENWTKAEIFWARRSDSTGRIWMAINGVVIADVSGPNFGSLIPPKPINRIMLSLPYTGGSYPLYEWKDDVQIWSGFPPACTEGDPTTPWCNPPYAPH